MSTTKSSRVIRAAAASAVCVALAFGTAGVALAGQGSHARDHSNISSHDNGQWSGARGTISALGTSSITLKDRKGNTTTYTTTSATTYFEGSTAGVVGDLAIGEQVDLALTPTTPQTVTKVTIDLARVSGTVTTVVGNVITITGWHNTTLTVNVSGTTTYTSGGAASTLAAVVTGAQISAVGLPGSTAGSLNAISVNIWAPRVSTHARGTISALGTNSITLKDRKGNTTTYTTTSATTYFEGSTAGVVGDLAIGEQVDLALTPTTPQTVTKVTIDLARVSGTVTTVVGNVITITGWHNTTLTVNVSGTTTYTSGGAASTLAAVVTGAQISAVGLPGSTAGSLNAISVNIWAPRVSTHARGTISALGTNSITLKDRKGNTTTYTTTSATTYFEGSTAGVVGDLAIGEQVDLALTPTTPQTVTKVTIDLARVSGTVTTVVGSVITITGWHNTTLTVNVSGTTTYTSGGAASTLAAVVTGAQISAVGLPGSTAGSLNAISVNIGVPFNHSGNGGHGHSHGQGFDSGHAKSFGHSRR